MQKEKEMSEAAGMKQNIPGQDIILKRFEKILKKKLDPIFKERSTYHNLKDSQLYKTEC